MNIFEEHCLTKNLENVCKFRPLVCFSVMIPDAV